MKRKLHKLMSSKDTGEAMGNKQISCNRLRELREWAICDARDTLLEEQSAEWFYNVRGTPEPRHRWLERHCRFDGRSQTEDEWTVYKAFYMDRLGRALAHLRKHFDAVWDLPDDEAAMADEAMIEECLDLIEEE